jgi:UDP-N-acetylmuramoylalanine--D-glutamate ligase
MFDLVILGAGESGTGAALLAKAKGMSVFVSDKGSIAPNYRKELEAADILFEENGHTDELILNASEVIKSPGIPESNLLVAKIKAKGIPVMDELEFATRFTRAKFIGITGSNGKTTTTLLAYHLMQGCGFSVGLAGNVGKSLARQVITDKFDWYVVEISSFQLDGMHGFQSDIAILTNITPDHLDRYDYKFENYIQSKFRIIKNLTPALFFITSGEDPVVLEELNKYAAMPNMIQAGLSEEKSTKLFFDGSNLNFKIGTLEELQIPASTLPISGTHNLMNSMMAVTAVLLAGGTPDKILASLETFQNAPHRCEAITIIAGVQFVNDSKATNVDSVKYDFSAYQKPSVWIAGGVD